MLCCCCCCCTNCLSRSLPNAGATCLAMTSDLALCPCSRFALPSPLPPRVARRLSLSWSAVHRCFRSTNVSPVRRSLCICFSRTDSFPTPCPKRILSVRRMIGFWDTEESSSGAHPSGARRKSRKAELPLVVPLPPDMFFFARVRDEKCYSLKCFSFVKKFLWGKRQRTKACVSSYHRTITFL